MWLRSDSVLASIQLNQSILFTGVTKFGETKCCLTVVMMNVVCVFVKRLFLIIWFIGYMILGQIVWFPQFSLRDQKGYTLSVVITRNLQTINFNFKKSFENFTFHQNTLQLHSISLIKSLKTT